MKKVGRPVFFVVLAIIIVLSTLSFFGLSYSYGDNTTTFIKGAGDIRWGIDIRGGVDVTFSPSDGYDATDEELTAAEEVIKVRLVSQNITDSEVYTDYNKDRIIVRFPWKEDETDFNPENAVQELGETALLTFRENLDGEIVLQGADVESAAAVVNTENSQYEVALNLTSEGAKKFADATSRLQGQQISIWMDDNMISAPYVEAQIPDGKATITRSGGFTIDEANTLAGQINSGALPFKLETENFSSISPTLGMGALDAMIMAGIIAFILVSIYTIVLYRLPGVIACFALLGQVAGAIACVSGFFGNAPSFTLTLPGIAGIILGIGMGVDANIITSERIKEELTIGKTIDGAIDSGFQRTFSAIFDGNITTILVAAVLMGAFGPPSSFLSNLFSPVFNWFGPSATGAIYSFGYTLIVSVIFNLLMGVLASRLMLKSISKFRAFKKPWLYGGAK